MDAEKLILLQNKILEVVEYFDYFCAENKITYYLMGGSALGAIRHKGFIPWDDDFDVFMDNENYHKFCKAASNKLDTDLFYFQKENTKEWPLFFSKIRMNGTTMIEKDVVGRAMHHGIYIDVMCLNKTVKSKAFRYVQYLAARILSATALSKKGYVTTSFVKRFLLMIVQVFSFKPVQKVLLAIVRQYNKKNSDLVGHFFGRAPFGRTTFNVNFLGNPRIVKFENLQLPVPSNVEEYLTIRYGKNYMRLPSEKEKMKYPSHAFIVDTEKSYIEYFDKTKEHTAQVLK